MKVVDEFDLIQLEENFTAKVKPTLSNHPLFQDEDRGAVG